MKRSNLNLITEFENGDTVHFTGTGIEITFTGVSTASMDNDDVISDAEFIIKYNQSETIAKIESTNGHPGKYEFSGFLLTLEYADGYSQICGLRLTEL